MPIIMRAEQVLYLSINIETYHGEYSLGTFYEIRLSRFPFDSGFTGRGRDLTDEEKRKNTGPAARTAIKNKVDPAGIFTGQASEIVVFDVSPTVTESRSADYADHGLPGPTGIVVYKITQNRRYSISGKFVSRTLTEAAKTYLYINWLRSWLVPAGDATGNSGPPPVLRLNGYQNHFFNIPVVLSELTINFPNDVDYIEVPKLAMVPIIQTVDISLIESHSRSTIKKGLTETDEKKLISDLKSEFDLHLFKVGILPGYS